MKIKYTTPFTMIENKIIRHEHLTIYQKMIFITLCSYANDNNVCFPSYETIAKAVGCSKRKVISTIKELVNLNLILKHKGKVSSSNEYEIVTGESPAPSNEQCALPDSAQGSPPSESHAPKQYTDNYTKPFNNNHLSITEQTELNDIIENCGIDGLKKEKDRDLFRQAITTMYCSKDITVCGTTYPQVVVRKNMQKLNYDVIVYVFDILKLLDCPPKSPINYLISVIYRGIFEVGIY